MTMTRIPLNIVATETGHVTEGVLVAVAASDLDDLLDLAVKADDLREALGELVDALSDEVRYEVSQSPHVIEKIDAACRLLGPNYEGYIGGWL